MNKGTDYTGIGIIFFCHDGQGNYLFNKRSKNARDEHGRWDPGGGGLEFGASVEDTLEQEIKEEYCTDVLDAEFLGFRDVHRTDDKGSETHWLALDFKVLVDREQVQNGEPHKFDEIGWFRLNNLPEPMHSQTPRALEQYRKQLFELDELEQPIGCFVIVQNQDSKILLGKRKNGYKAGWYGAPGGRVDGQEKLVDCARRELEEETGLEATTLDYLGVIKQWQGSFNFIHFVYLCKDWSGEVETREPDKCESWEWFDPHELPKQILAGHQHGISMLKTKKPIIDL